MKNFISLIARRLLFITAFFFMNLQSMQPNGPHRNLVWGQNWCWMDGALQCLAANDVFVEKLQQENDNFPDSPWVKELSNVLNAIRDTTQPNKIDPSKLYDLLQKARAQLPNLPKEGCFGGSKEFIRDIFNFIFKQTGWEKTRKKITFEVTVDSEMLHLYYVDLHPRNPITLALLDFYDKSSLFDFKPIDLPWYDADNPTAVISLRFSDYFMFYGGVLGLKNFSQLAESETNLTLDGKPRKYSCYAITVGGTGHVIAYIKDKKSSQWFYYNDMHPEVYGKPVTIQTIDKDLNNEKISFILFYQKVEKPTALEEKLTQLKAKLERLKTNLAALAKKLSDLKSSLKKS